MVGRPENKNANCRWIYDKIDECEIFIRYRVQFVAKGFSQTFYIEKFTTVFKSCFRFLVAFGNQFTLLIPRYIT